MLIILTLLWVYWYCCSLEKSMSLYDCNDRGYYDSHRIFEIFRESGNCRGWDKSRFIRG